MKKRMNVFTSTLIIFALILSLLYQGTTAKAYVVEPAYYHAGNQLLQNGNFETVNGGQVGNWFLWGNGYAVSSAEGCLNSKAVVCENSTGIGEYGLGQLITINRSSIKPILVKGWSKSENVSGNADSGYSIYIDVTYMDNTTLWGQSKSFKTGTNGWSNVEFTITPAKPVKSLGVYLLMRGHTGKVWFDDISVEELPADILQNVGFENISNGQATAWAPWKSGYVIDGTAGLENTKAVKCYSTSTLTESGINQTAYVNRTTAKPVLIRGWSKAENVTGSKDSGYSLYVDIIYSDDTASWGNFVSFETGTHDWQYKELFINPKKPIKYITVYGLFARHTGTVWFDNLSVEELNSNAAMKVLDASTVGSEITTNGNFENDSNGYVQNWFLYGQGYTLGASQGRNGSKSVICEDTTGQGTYGLGQYIILNRTEQRLLALSGWSKAENVSGSKDNGYCLYADITFMDDTTLWAQTSSFSTGTHDWEKTEFIINPEKPVKSVSLYAMFRGHNGKVYFDDITVREITNQAAFYDGACVSTLQVPQQGQRSVLSTSDGLSMTLGDTSINSIKVDGVEIATGSAPSGFLVRDVAENSDVYAFRPLQGQSSNQIHGICNELDLEVNATFTEGPNCIKVSGRLTDKRQTDRAVTMTFALPVDASGWKWGDYIRKSRNVSTGDAGDIYTDERLVDFETEKLSVYPTTALFNNKGISLGIDLGKPAHYKLEYNGATKQLLLTYRFGLVPETQNFPSSADFSFVIYKFSPEWGYREAFKKYTEIYPDYYTVRSQDQGIWMPFVELAKIEGWQDFGIKYKEGVSTNMAEAKTELAYNKANNVYTFRYTELSTYWMKMDPGIPRTTENAIMELDRLAALGDKEAIVAKNCKALGQNGQPVFSFINAPWCNGVRWMLNSSGNLPYTLNSVTHNWGNEYMTEMYGSEPSADGEYLDTLDGWPADSVNYNREHFRYAVVPLTYSKYTKRPVIYRQFSAWESTKWLADTMHGMNKMLMANGTPHTFSIYTPLLDVMGIERTWLNGTAYVPDKDELLSQYRTLSYQKPYLLLQNTDFSKFTNEYMDRYMQRSMFYGIFPSAFSSSADDATNYWRTGYYQRDRGLFKKYIPIIKQISESGWEPVTYATSNNSNVLVERFGEGGTTGAYITVMNNTDTAQSASIAINSTGLNLSGQLSAQELVSKNNVSIVNNTFSVSLSPYQTIVVKVIKA